MTDSVSFTIPATGEALFRTGAALIGMAQDIGYRPQQPAERTGPQRVPAGGEGGMSLQPVPGPADQSGEADAAPATPPAPPQEPEHPEVPDGVELEQTPELDADGLPWDERIHSGSKAKNKDGTWRKRKGVWSSLVEEVEAELRGATPEPAPQPVSNPGPPPGHDMPGQPEPPTAPAAVPPAPPQESAGEPLTFAQLMVRINEAGILPETLNAALERMGVASLPAVSGSPGLTQRLHAELFGDE